MISPRTVGLVAIGGALGTLLRDALGHAAPVAPGTFPTIVLVINVAGSWLLGFLLGTLTRRRPDDHVWQPFLGTGVLGGFTTFSTFAVATVQLIRVDEYLTALVYVVTSVVGGLAAATFGVRCTGIAPRFVVEGEQ